MVRSCLVCAGPLALSYFLFRLTKCSEQGDAVGRPALLAPITVVAASAKPQSQNTSSSLMVAAAGRTAPADRKKGAIVFA